MESLDLMIEIERYLTRSGLTHSDSIDDLLESLSEEIE